MRKILGVNISHHCSFAYFENKILKEFYEEERFNYIKGYEPEDKEDGNYTYKYKAIEKFKNINFDVVVISSADRGHLQIELPIIKHLLKQIKHKIFYFDIKKHHIYHALCGFYFSKFDEAIALTSDGGGEREFKYIFSVLQAIHLVNKKNVETKYKLISNNKHDLFNNFSKVPEEVKKKSNNVDFIITNKSKAGLKYTNYRQMAGFKCLEEGQLMGIAAYKNKKTNIDKNILEIAHKAQEETLQDIIDLVEKSKKYSDCKNIILSGGYHMNCLNNFKLVKLYPEYNFFVDPISYDAGTAVGAAYYYENYL